MSGTKKNSFLYLLNRNEVQEFAEDAGIVWVRGEPKAEKIEAIKLVSQKWYDRSPVGMLKAGMSGKKVFK